MLAMDVALSVAACVCLLGGGDFSRSFRLVGECGVDRTRAEAPRYLGRRCVCMPFVGVYALCGASAAV